MNKGGVQAFDNCGKKIYSDFDLVELKAKFESLEEALEEENQLAARTTTNRFESSATDIHDSNIKIQENQNETHRQENPNTTHNRLHQLEPQYCQTANQNFERQIQERQAETPKRNIERECHVLNRIAIDNLERNQRADKSQQEKLGFKATITEDDEKIYEQLATYIDKRVVAIGEKSRAYIDKNVAAVREESRTYIDERVVAVREESRTLIDERVVAVREESRTLINENVAAVREESRTLIDERVVAVREESRTYIEAINRQYNDQRTPIQEHFLQIRETGKLLN